MKLEDYQEIFGKKKIEISNFMKTIQWELSCSVWWAEIHDEANSLFSLNLRKHQRNRQCMHDTEIRVSLNRCGY